MIRETGSCNRFYKRSRFLTGMRVQFFKGFPELQEVECLAAILRPELKLFSLKMFSVDNNVVLATANAMTEECVTFTEYSSCYVDRTDSRKSKIRVLVSDMKEGEMKQFGCRVNSFDSLGDTITTTWSITVERKGEFSWIVFSCFKVPSTPVYTHQPDSHALPKNEVRLFPFSTGCFKDWRSHTNMSFEHNYAF